MIDIKILSPRSPQRYAVSRTLLAAQDDMLKMYPDFEMAITEIRTLTELEQYTSVIILPSLVVNGKLVCVGRFPKKEEVIRWLQEAME